MDNIKEFSKKAIRDILHANIDVHSRILIYEFPRDKIIHIEKVPSHSSNMTFAEKLGMIELSSK